MFTIPFFNNGKRTVNVHSKEESTTPFSIFKRPALATDTVIKRATEHAASSLELAPDARASKPSQELPPAEVIFKELLQAPRENSNDHVDGISGLAYAFASLVHLSVQRANNDISSCFDLYPLYGRDNDSDQVRLKDGTGMLSPDCFFDDRLILLPRASAVLLILFNRHHNYIARRLLLHGEILSDSSSGVLSTIAQDDRIFAAARRINCAHFRNIMQEDILKLLVGLSTSDSTSYKSEILSAKKGYELGAAKYKPANESALLYDWSSLMSTIDIRDVETTMREIFNEEANLVLHSAFDGGLAEFKSTINKNKRNRNHAGLRRQGNGRFLDADLANVLYEGTDTPAGKAGKGVPLCQKVIAIKTIEWARRHNTCTLNEYRKFLGLRPFLTFNDWSNNGEIVASAQKLYKSIDNLEVYVGLHAESGDADNWGFPSRFGYTKTYGLLVDIISRIRNDPDIKAVISESSTNLQLTRWGHNDCQAGPENGAFGASLPKLLQRTLPHEYPHNSSYGLFPLRTSDYIGKLLLPKEKYNTTRPKSRIVHHLVTKDMISYVCNNPALFPTMYEKDLRALTEGYGYLLGFDDEEKHDRDQMMSLHALIPDRGALQRYARSFAQMAIERIKANEVRNLGANKTQTNEPKEIDVAHDVINAVCTQWVCETLLDYPLKPVKIAKTSGPGSAKTPGYHRIQSFFLGPFYKVVEVIQHKLPWIWHWVTDHTADTKYLDQAELHDHLAALYTFVFHNVDPEHEWQLREQVPGIGNYLRDHIRKKLPGQNSTTLLKASYIGYLTDSLLHFISVFIFKVAKEFTGTETPGETAQTFLERAVSTNWSIPPPPPVKKAPSVRDPRIVANVIGLAVVAAVKYAKVCTQAVDFYLQPQYSDELKKIIELSTTRKDEKDSKTLLMGYIREAYRLNHPLGVWRCVAGDSNSDIEIPYGRSSSKLVVKTGDLLYANFSKAFTAADSSDVNLQDPLKVNPHRRINGIQGLGLHKCAGITFVEETMPEIFKAIFSLDGLRRAPGRRGNLVQFTAHPDPKDTDPRSFLDSKDKQDPFPRSLVLGYDAVWEPKRAPSGPPKKIVNKDVWRNAAPGVNNMHRDSIMNRIHSLLLILTIGLVTGFIVYELLSLFLRLGIALLIFFFEWATSALTGLPPLPQIRSSPASGPLLPTACVEPITDRHPWEIATMRARRDGTLKPFEYTLRLSKAHRLFIVDIDAKDMSMGMYVDGIFVGATEVKELNKTESCKEADDCLRRDYSGGHIVVPRGKHTVRIQWAGFERPGPNGRVDWGREGGRRFAWKQQSCSQ